MVFRSSAYIPREPKVFEVLLVDPDPNELSVVRRALSLSLPVRAEVEQAASFEAALTQLATSRYDFVLLCNSLLRTLTVPRTVPVINLLRGDAPLAVISHNISLARQSCASDLEVDHVLDKASLIQFFGGLFKDVTIGTACNTCDNFLDGHCRKKGRSNLRAVG
ncbi:MAG: hypothetical protein AAF311_10365 [Pseudomonadota bacterium]